MARAATKRSTTPETTEPEIKWVSTSPPQTREDRAIYRAIKILESRLRAPGPQCGDPLAAEKLARLHLASLDIENFACLFLDAQHRLISFEIVASGTIDAAAVYPREVVRRVLFHGAAAVIFAHNHPSGVANPSAGDRVLTDRLRQALALVDVKVLDHLVIGNGVSASFAARGWL